MSIKKNTDWRSLGRRKSSVARVKLSNGKGIYTINNRNIDDYFGGRDVLKMVTKQPLELLGVEGKYDVDVNVSGGGLSGQAGAIRLGISRGIQEINPDHRKLLKENGFLTRDSREVERKKPGQPGARKKFQFSKR
tara:strand:- start:240 stop:644 length:405 start_codon:yes stop_codon:yes gene_type:complete